MRSRPAWIRAIASPRWVIAAYLICIPRSFSDKVTRIASGSPTTTAEISFHIFRVSLFAPHAQHLEGSLLKHIIFKYAWVSLSARICNFGSLANHDQLSAYDDGITPTRVMILTQRCATCAIPQTAIGSPSAMPVVAPRGEEKELPNCTVRDMSFMDSVHNWNSSMLRPSHSKSHNTGILGNALKHLVISRIYPPIELPWYTASSTCMELWSESWTQLRLGSPPEMARGSVKLQLDNNRFVTVFAQIRNAREKIVMGRIAEILLAISVFGTKATIANIIQPGRPHLVACWKISTTSCKSSSWNLENSGWDKPQEPLAVLLLVPLMACFHSPRFISWVGIGASQNPCCRASCKNSGQALISTIWGLSSWCQCHYQEI